VNDGQCERALGNVAVGTLAGLFLVACYIQQVVGDLESNTAVQAESFQRPNLILVGMGQESSKATASAEKGCAFICDYVYVFLLGQLLVLSLDHLPQFTFANTNCYFGD
jgi:hypothetical protein